MLRVVFHHVPGGERTAGIQGFIDSPLGVGVGTAAHTIGAMAFFAGIFLSWRWIRRGGPGIGLARAITWIGIGLNGVGGLMRLYASDHPTLSVLDSSPWVQAMLAKHVFLVVGMLGAAALAVRAPRFDPVRPTASLIAVTALVSGIAAGGLGAYAATVPIDAVAAPPEPPMGDDEGHGAGAAGRLEAPRYRNFTGTITGTPLAPGTVVVEVDVAPGTAALQADLAWTTPAAVLSLTASGPGGASVEGAESGETSRQAAVLSPAAGLWRLTIGAERALNEAYTLVVRAAPNATVAWERTFVLAPGAGVGEINFNMDADGEILYGFEVVGSAAEIYWNVHSHPGGEVVIHAEGTDNAYEAAFVAEGDEIYSVLWQNEGAAPVTVRAWIRGAFTVHSQFGT